jgi:sucrose-6-phosphate hydrolase SacC (GH32 family)
MATSTDGGTWTKYDDPATTDKPLMDSDPVFQPGENGAWDAGWVHQPRVFQTPNGWIMIYRGTSDTRGSVMKLGLATSQDGIHWDRFEGNPIFKPSDIKGASQFWFTNVVVKDDVLYLFVEGDINQTTQIYLATHRGMILP